MSSDYSPPDPGWAEIIHRDRIESDRQERRLKNSPPGKLREIARDPSQSPVARRTALMFLLIRRDPELPGIVLELFDDPDQDLWAMVIRSSHLADPRVAARLRGMLDSTDGRNWSEAACALATAGDETLLPRLTVWLEGGDRPHRNVAIECLRLLATSEALPLLQEFWAGTTDEEDRLVAGAAILSLGDTRALPLLESTAKRAAGPWSVFAATSIYSSRRAAGLELMLHILDAGDLEARQSMVMQIWNFAELPHAFTADGIHEARVWAERRLEDEAGSSRQGSEIHCGR